MTVYLKLSPLQILNSNSKKLIILLLKIRLSIMSDETDNGGPPEEVEKQWDQYNRISFPYATNNLPRNHPSYRNQYILQPPCTPAYQRLPTSAYQMDPYSNMSNTITPTRDFPNYNRYAHLYTMNTPMNMNQLLSPTTAAREVYKTNSVLNPINAYVNTSQHHTPRKKDNTEESLTTNSSMANNNELTTNNNKVNEKVLW